MARECAEQGGTRLHLSQHMKLLWDKVGYNARVDHRDDDGEEEYISERVSYEQPPLQNVQPDIPHTQTEVSVTQTENYLSSEDNSISLSSQSQEQVSPEQTNIEQPLEHTFLNESQTDNLFRSIDTSENVDYSDRALSGTQNGLVESDSQGPLTTTDLKSPQTPIPDSKPPDNAAVLQTHDSITQKISPGIQEKVEKFETDETKRKAEESPEVSKKDKKKSKNQEKSSRKMGKTKTV